MYKYLICFLTLTLSFSYLLVYAQDYPYPINPNNTTTINNATPVLEWTGGSSFNNYTVEIFECTYSPNANFNSINLEEYQLAEVKEGLTGYEASALTLNEKMTNQFFTVDDEGSKIIAYDNNFNTNQEFSAQQYAGNDYEGLTYLYDNYFVMVEERLDLLFFLKMQYNTSGDLTGITEVAQRSTNNSDISGANNGYEGITYNPVENKLYLIKEYNPMGLFEFVAPSGSNFTEAITISEPFNLQNASWRPDDVAGLYHLSLNKTLSATPAGEHLLLLSQEDKTIYEIDLDGNLISEKILDPNGAIANYSEGFFQPEGIAYNDGKIWIASEGTFNKTAKFYAFENSNYAAPTANFSTNVITQNNITTTQWQVPTCTLKPNKNYCWRVTAHLNNGSTVVSETFNFYTQFANEDCGAACPLNINHYPNTPLEPSYFAASQITSSASTNNVLLYNAGNRIKLKNGFHAVGFFSAHINTCP